MPTALIARVRRRLGRLRDSFWFLPALMVTGFAIAAVLLVEAEAHVGWEMLRRWPRLFGAGADGSRSMLSAVAGSMATVAGVVFSITMLALSQTSAQFSTRLLRGFMRDRANQTVLGVFVGIFAYCLIVLRTIRGGDENTFVPALAVLGGTLFGVASIGFLIHFIHHISVSLQVSHIIANVTAETLQAVEHLFPAPVGTPAAETVPEERSWRPVTTTSYGYLQGVDADALLDWAERHNAGVRMDRQVGEFLVPGTILLSLSTDEAPTAEQEDALRGLFPLGRYRTIEQDAAYGIQQLVDVALRALSPGINDTTTAVMCIQHLSVILVKLAERRVEGPTRSDRQGRVRVIACGPDFAQLAHLAFRQIQESAEGNTAAIRELERALEVVADRTVDSQRRAVLAELRGRIHE